MNSRRCTVKAGVERSRRIQPVLGNLDESAAALRIEVGRCAARINEHVGHLSSIGNQAFDSTGDLSREASAADLRRFSAGLRGVVCHALAVLTDIQSEVGRLEALAVFRELESATAWARGDARYRGV